MLHVSEMVIFSTAPLLSKRAVMLNHKVWEQLPATLTFLNRTRHLPCQHTQLNGIKA